MAGRTGLQRCGEGASGEGRARHTQGGAGRGGVSGCHHRQDAMEAGGAGRADGAAVVEHAVLSHVPAAQAAPHVVQVPGAAR